MRLGFLLIFIAVPLLELALLIKLGGWIGIWPTLGLIVLTAVVGTALLRQQGLQTLNKLMSSVQEGEAPLLPMVEGALLLISGAFLLSKSQSPGTYESYSPIWSVRSETPIGSQS